MARKSRERATTRDSTSSQPSSSAAAERKEKERAARTSGISITNQDIESMAHTGVRVRGEDALPLALPLPLPSLPKMRVIGRVGVVAVKLSPRKSEYSPRKFALASPTLKIPRPPPTGRFPVPGYGADISKQRQRERANTLPPSQGRAIEGREQRECDSLSVSPSPSPSPTSSQARDPKRRQQQRHHHHRHQSVKRVVQPQPLHAIRHDNEWFSNVCGDNKNNISGNNRVASRDRGEISVDELKKRLSQLIGVSLTELEKLFDGPHQ